MTKGKFIVFEGIDGAGTTTQTQLLCEYLEKGGISPLKTAEPTDGAVGRLIREILRGKIQTAGETLALLFAADRIEHWSALVKPAIESGQWVISDRYVLSSIAYQSLYCDPEWVKAINIKAVEPDLTILLDLPVDDALSRLGKRGDAREIFEKKEILEKVRKSYLDAARAVLPGKITIIDSSVSIDDVHNQAVAKINSL